MLPQALNKWSKHILMATPLLFLLPMTYLANKPGICLYVMLWMVVYWVSAVIPLPVTSLMPLVLFPLLGILSAEETATAYFDEVGATIFASLVFGAALESTGLATRVALQMLSVVGTSFSR
ncbi:Na(+)/dicarboxylate cotransporter 3-like [Rhipicephalus microplus]|uniref:Na(+)/dicarboxylate cotransporter 3-like n=1 Tax=Rhipicephalus microplus TaxID=6941 RepID=UPI003F6B0716